jgi:hypothetical protein
LKLSYTRLCRAYGVHFFKKILKHFRALGWKYGFKTCSSRNAAILNTVTEMTAADIARAGVTAGRNVAALFRGHIKFEVVTFRKNL